MSWAQTRRIGAGFQTAIALVYPPRCLGCGTLVQSDFGLCGRCWRDTPFIGGTVCDLCGVPLIGPDDGGVLECDQCMRHPRPWDRGRAALLYQGQARRLVLALKHGDRTDIAGPAARWMARAGRGMLDPGALIVPVPLHRGRLWRRRYNQSALLARALARDLGADCCPDLLLRHRPTPSLEGRGAAERFRALEGAIAAHPRHRAALAGRAVVLVDDVMTSGATLAACATACRAAGAGDVAVMILARVANPPQISEKGSDAFGRHDPPEARRAWGAWGA